MITRVLARLAVVVGLALIAAGITPQPAPEPLPARKATPAEERAWQVDQLSRLIDEHRAAQRQ